MVESDCQPASIWLRVILKQASQEVLVVVSLFLFAGSKDTGLVYQYSSDILYVLVRSVPISFFLFIRLKSICEIDLVIFRKDLTRHKLGGLKEIVSTGRVS